ncbi:MAG: hypothetical protein HOJ35_00080 [Bdellovibrionales bacterium]|nr:hypothetical protein [Bdellovibrionales bacterium]
MQAKFLILILLILSSSIVSFGASDTNNNNVFIKAEFANENEKLEVTTVLVTDKISENYELTDWARNQLLGNHDSTIVVLDDGTIQNKRYSQRLYSTIIEKLSNVKKNIRTVKSSIDQGLVNKANSGKELFFKHERISLSLLRTVINGTTVSTGLIIASGLTPAASISIGVLSGSLSGLVQFFNPEFQSLIDGNHEKNQKMIKESRVGGLKVKTMQLTRWFLTEVALYTLIEGFSISVGAPSDTLMRESYKVLKSSLLATASQGLWDSTVASETKERLREAGNNAELRQKVQFNANVKAFAVSMVSVFGGVMTLVGSPVGSWSLGILGVTGVLYTAKSWYIKKQSAKSNRIDFMLVNCHNVFM